MPIPEPILDVATRPPWARQALLRQAFQHYEHCLLCEHRCGVRRIAERSGFCKADDQPRVFRHRVEYGDESELVPSLLIYLSGCDLRCVYCINELNAFDPRRGQPLTAEVLGRALAEGRREGAVTLQWVGGEPTIHLPAILEAMSWHAHVPRIVWKTDMHGTPEALALLDGVVDLYLADFKFGNDACARRLAKVDRYVEILTRNLLQAARQGEVIVRHLVLPGHFECCLRPIVQWCRDQQPTFRLSLREGYLPHWQSDHYLELGRPLSRSEFQQARDLALSMGVPLVR